MVLKDIRGARLGVAIYFGVTAIQVAAIAVSAQRDPRAGFAHASLAFTPWALQFLLVAHIIHRDAPSRVGAQWRTRPFSPAQLIASKVIGIGGFVLLPPWIASQVVRGALGLGWGIGSRHEILYHAAILAIAILLALSSRSAAKALLLGICLLVVTMLVATFWRDEANRYGLVGIPLPPEVLFSLCVLFLASIGLWSAYAKGHLARPLALAVVPVASLFLLVPFHYEEPQSSPTVLATAEETLTFKVEVAPSSPNRPAEAYLGNSTHEPKDLTHVVSLESVSRPDGPTFGWGGHDPLSGLVRNRLGAPVMIRNLGLVHLSVPPNDPWAGGAFFAGFLQAVVPGTGREAGKVREATLTYGVRTFELLDRSSMPLRRNVGNSRWWHGPAAVPNESWRPTLGLTSARVPARVAVFDPKSSQLQFLGTEYCGPTVTDASWPVGTGLFQICFRDPGREGLEAFLDGKELVVLSESIVARGTKQIEIPNLRIPVN